MEGLLLDLSLFTLFNKDAFKPNEEGKISWFKEANE